MGGALSIASSVLLPEVDAVVAFYGVPSSELADPAKAKAPVQAHFGELDSFVGFSDVTMPVNGPKVKRLWVLAGIRKGRDEGEKLSGNIIYGGIQLGSTPSSPCLILSKCFWTRKLRANYHNRISQAAKALEEKLKASGVPYEVHIYPGNGHAFMNRSPEGIQRRKGMGMPDEDEDAVGLAWSRFRAWMSCYLSP
ncbi:hypothetical protein CK203_026267 [Vitis vinifera]|uniref:Dienelactone hydrolase domain-containing protein n=1 Tax=Vitis vinifera TaxID=29760 RepID=A0A438IL66_VITVI|nr:hypothetical protein CK203_026267 [Vitis vinifera]